MPLTLLLISGCSTSRYSASGTDDVYSRSTLVQTRESTPKTTQPASKYRQQAPQQYGEYYDEDSRSSYSSYSTRLKRFHSGYSNNYYSRLYIGPGSFGYSWSPFGSSYLYGGYSWSNWNYHRPPGMSWYDWHIYNYHYPLWNSWSSWSYFPSWYSPWHSNYWGWNSWNPWSPWYTEHHHYYYNPGKTNVQRYYGPRNWGGSNTPTGGGNVIERLPTPTFQPTPGNNTNFGRQTTPSGIQINKGVKSPAVTPQAPQTPGPSQPVQRGNIRYYSPGAPTPSVQPSQQPSQGSGSGTNPGGIQINRGEKKD